MKRKALFPILGFMVVCVSLAGCSYSSEGYPAVISFSAQGGTMTLESGTSWKPDICEFGADDISNHIRNEDENIVVGRWLTVKQNEMFSSKLEIIAEPNDTRKTRVLYISNQIASPSDMESIKVVQYGRK